MALTSPHTAYEADGFYICDEPLLPADMVASAVRGMDEIRTGRYDRGQPPLESQWSPGDDPDRLCKIEQPQFANQAIFDLIRHPGLGRLAATVAGARWVQVWWIQLLYKPSTEPGAVAATTIGWHQDRNYWDSWKEGSTLFTAWVALSDVEDDCGPMRFLRGSHKWGYQEGLSEFQDDDLEKQKQAIMARGMSWDEVPALAPAGGVSFHDRLTFHGSGANHSGRPRRSLAIHLRTESSWPNLESENRHYAYVDDPGVCPVIYNA